MTDPMPADADTPTAAVLLIGNEILSGRTQDKNLAYMGERLAARGIRLGEARVIPDIPPMIVETLNALRARYHYVFTTGGIGPTHDDITADCVAEAFGVALDEHPEARRRLEVYSAERGIALNADRLRMARIPAGGTLIDNPVSAAPGFVIDNVYVMAGVPRIMQAMFDSILPTLASGATIHSISVSCNLGEGTLAGALRDIQARHTGVEIGSYPGFSDQGLRVSLVARGTDQSQLASVADALRTMIVSLGGQVLDTRDG